MLLKLSMSGSGVIIKFEERYTKTTNHKSIGKVRMIQVLFGALHWFVMIN